MADRESHAQHSNGSIGEVVCDRGLREPPLRPVPAMDPGAHPEESEGGELWIGPDERPVAHATADYAFEHLTHGPLLGVYLPQRRRWHSMFLPQLQANAI